MRPPWGTRSPVLMSSTKSPEAKSKRFVMNESSNSKVAAARDAYRKTAAQFDDLVPTQLPEAMRSLAEKNIAQTRELYERSKDALESAVQSWERSFDVVGQGVVALNRKVIDIAQRNINSSFDLAKNLAG